MPPSPRKLIDTQRGAFTYREQGTGPALVFLHGIGSGSESWQAQIDSFAENYRTIAWDAPGYGGSTSVVSRVPNAAEYADRLEALLDALEITSCNLVGHSLGALMACSYAKTRKNRVASLMIASPAAGYGASSPDVQSQRRVRRLELLDKLGPEGLARERHGVLLSDDAPQWARDRVRKIMGEIHADGYRQAVELLVCGDILSDAKTISLPVTVVVGGADTVTPPDGCEMIANTFMQSEFKILPGVGHACYVEGPEAFNAALIEHLEEKA